MRPKVTTACHRPNRSWSAASVQDRRRFSAGARASKATIIDLASTQRDLTGTISLRSLEIKTRTRYTVCERQSLTWRAPFARSAVTLAG